MRLALAPEPRKLVLHVGREVELASCRRGADGPSSRKGASGLRLLPRRDMLMGMIKRREPGVLPRRVAWEGLREPAVAAVDAAGFIFRQMGTANAVDSATS